MPKHVLGKFAKRMASGSRSSSCNTRQRSRYHAYSTSRHCFCECEDVTKMVSLAEFMPPEDRDGGNASAPLEDMKAMERNDAESKSELGYIL